MTVGGNALPSTFTTRTARTLGLHPRDLYRMRDDGELIELSRGVFRQADAPAPDWADLLAVAFRAPNAIVSCVSALVVHDLTDEIPAAVQIAVPRAHRPPRISYPPVEVFRFASVTFELGLSALEAAPGENIRIYDAERTVVDLMRLRHRLGEPLAHAALRRYLRRRNARPGQLLALADQLGVLGPVRAALDVASAE
ncbi:MAG TPA: type IV toxin-antitoxin system AbiEi family antitoxin domain-containing protein [Actinophytocola sp.]|nr:type IV toxin-antitoxin system AbiEi family antitoxin domain-containing protein [Actinophytocola sp.]